MTATLAQSASTQVVSAEAFWHMAQSDKKVELVRGEVVQYMAPGGLHGGLSLGIGSLLRIFARSSGGYAGVEAGFLLERNPDVVRLPDVSFVCAEHIPDTGIPETFWNQAPDVAVEVISPSELADDIQEKVRLYLRAGTQQIWTVYPRQRIVVIHTADNLARTLQDTDILLGFDVLKGFESPVSALFEL